MVLLASAFFTNIYFTMHSPNNKDRIWYLDTELTIPILNLITSCFLAIAAMATITGILIEQSLIHDPAGVWRSTCHKTSSFFALCYFVFRLQSYHFYQSAAMKVHALDMNIRFDDIRLAMINNQQYTDEIEEAEMVENGIAIYHLHYYDAITTYEKSFYTYALVKRLRYRTATVCALFTVIFVTSIFLGVQNAVMNASMTMATILLFYQLIRQFLLQKRLEQINSYYLKFFTQYKPASNLFYLQQNKIEFEKVMSWACTYIPQDINNKMNPILMVQWAQTKSRLYILQ